MTTEKVERRLAAILVADMVAFSRLMEIDEEGTITRQKAHRAELIDPTIDLHHGRILRPRAMACWSFSRVSSKQ